MRTAADAQPTPHGRLQEVTSRYARYSRTAAGLGNVLAGVLVLITYFVGALVEPLGTPLRLALVAAPVVWIVTKELLRARYYQRLGRVSENWSRGERVLHVVLTLFTLAVAAFVATTVLVAARGDLAAIVEVGALGYLAFSLAMPVLVWFFMRTPLEFVVGVFLVAQAALIAGGGNYELGSQLQAPIAAVVLLFLGARQHREFRALERELASLQATLP